MFALVRCLRLLTVCVVVLTVLSAIGSAGPVKSNVAFESAKDVAADDYYDDVYDVETVTDSDYLAYESNGTEFEHDSTHFPTPAFDGSKANETVPLNEPEFARRKAPIRPVSQKGGTSSRSPTTSTTTTTPMTSKATTTRRFPRPDGFMDETEEFVEEEGTAKSSSSGYSVAVVFIVFEVLLTFAFNFVSVFVWCKMKGKCGGLQPSEPNAGPKSTLMNLLGRKKSVSPAPKPPPAAAKPSAGAVSLGAKPTSTVSHSSRAGARPLGAAPPGSNASTTTRARPAPSHPRQAAGADDSFDVLDVTSTELAFTDLSSTEMTPVPGWERIGDFFHGESFSTEGPQSLEELLNEFV